MKKNRFLESLTYTRYALFTGLSNETVSKLYPVIAVVLGAEWKIHAVDGSFDPSSSPSLYWNVFSVSYIYMLFLHTHIS